MYKSVLLFFRRQAHSYIGTGMSSHSRTKEISAYIDHICSTFNGMILPLPPKNAPFSCLPYWLQAVLWAVLKILRRRLSVSHFYHILLISLSPVRTGPYSQCYLYYPLWFFFELRFVAFCEVWFVLARYVAFLCVRWQRYCVMSIARFCLLFIFLLLTLKHSSWWSQMVCRM